jgi:hypothetical protein
MRSHGAWRGRAGTRAVVGSVLTVVVAACGSPSPSSTTGPGTAATASAVVSPTASPSVAPSPTPAALWTDATADTIGTTAEWSNKVEIADVTGDGRPDILFANGGDYESPGEPEPLRVFDNGSGGFSEVTTDIFGEARFLSRVVKVADVDGDDDADIVVGGTYATPTRLYRGAGDGTYAQDAEGAPDTPMSIGDLEAGDVDADGDLDLVLADWGEGSPMANAGGPVRLWRNDGGSFTADDAAMPSVAVRFAWELELTDVDTDWDLDVVVSCKMCTGSYLFENDGQGKFTDVTADRMPQFTNNYEFEAMDLDGDGDPELTTINDGPDRGRGLTEHVFRNDGGSFTDVTDEWWPADANPGFDDNIVVYLDADSDGDADFLIGSLDGPDRLLINDGSGGLTLQTGIFDSSPSGGTLGMAAVDLDGDGRLDVVESQGEVTGHEAERVYLGVGIALDTAAPHVTVGPAVAGNGTVTIVARVHDRLTPVRTIDFADVSVAPTDPGGEAVPLHWAGGDLWRARLPIDAGTTTFEVCATDRTGNRTCSGPFEVAPTG